MRTGSNYLEANLNSLEGVSSYGEVFNPHFVGKKDATELFGITLDEREVNPKPLLRKLRNETEGLSGFRLFHDHDARVLDLVLADQGCAKIVLTRNPVDSYASWLTARATGQWKLTDAKRLKSAKVRFDAAEFRAHLAAAQAFHLQVLNALQVSGQTAFVIDYEDLASVDVLNGLAAFLGVEGRLKAVDDTLKKQNPEPLQDRLENPQDLAPALASADLFGLARTPIFEPRRAAAIPQAFASDAAGLLFFPVRGAPDATIRDWLASFGRLHERFDHKTLRQWKRAHPGHRSFTVLRHPALRAYVTFHDRIVSGVLTDHRRILIRAYRAWLPELGNTFPDVVSERAAFLVFLAYARLATMGQTGLRVDPSWASQTAVVQGFASFQPLDVMIREDCLADGLGFIGAKLVGPPPRADAINAAEALGAIYDDEVEAAVEAAYARDYMGFGFSRWRV